MQDMKNKVLKGIHSQRLFGPHNSPDVEHVSAGDLEIGCMPSGPVITAGVSTPVRGS